jgi:WD40 repeat protein
MDLNTPLNFLTPMLELSGLDVAICVFDKRSSLFGCGCMNGCIYIWDFLTIRSKKPIKKLHSDLLDTVISLSFSNNFLFSAHSNGSIVLWDIVNGTIVCKYSFGPQLLTTAINSNNPFVIFFL